MSWLPLPCERPLGATGLVASPLGWGMWRLSESRLSTAQLAELLERLLDAGITLMDTADIYGFDRSTGFGAAETRLGIALTANPSLRRRIVLSTKGGIRPPVPYDQSGEYLARAIDESLRRLHVDTIDLWHVHRPDILTHPHEVARTLDAAVAQGKIRALGVSNFTVHQIDALQRFLGNRLVATQPEISPLRIACFENGELDQAMMLGLTPLAWSPIGGGRLTEPRSERECAVAQALDRVAEASGVSRVTAAYSWLMAHPAGIVPLIGSQQPERILGALPALRVRWTREDWYAVLVAARGHPLP